jgi:6-phosphogluconate dehydrogenase (decarboxylating)
MASDADASYDDDLEIKSGELTPIVTWGVNPGQSIAIDESVPAPVLSAALFARFSSRGESEMADRLLSAMRYEFGGHRERSPD